MTEDRSTDTMHDLKTLLGSALQRNQISREVTTARILDVAGETIAAMLPAGRATDATATGYRDGTVYVNCRHGAVAELIWTNESTIIDTIKRTLPSANIQRIKTKVV